MRRCIDLASCAEGNTYPNPLVGSVVVHEGRIIGEGYHLKAGTAHAEVVAINSVRQRELLASSALYVNLEPCSHYGKTPPCSEFIIRSGIRKVIVGTTDTSDKVSGKGISQLRDAGCEVIAGIMESECRHLNRRFFTYHERKRPYVILKWAQSQDGFIDVERKEGSSPGPNWISGKPERVLVHRWRSEEQSILAGAGTVRLDNPKLNVREWAGNNPVRLVISSSGAVPGYSAVFTGSGESVLFTHGNDRAEEGIKSHVLDTGEPTCQQVLSYLYEKGLQSVFVEGGAEILNHFISNGLWDEIRVFKGKLPFGSGVRAPQIQGRLSGLTEFEGSTLEVYFF